MSSVEFKAPYSNPSGLSCSLTPTAVTIEANIIATGPRGEQGEKGISGDLNYVHNQIVPSKEWLCVHNLGKFTSITVVDSAGNVVEGDITIVDNNSVVIRFNASFSGKAFFN